MVDLWGPGAFGAAGAAAVRPSYAPANGTGDPDTYYQDCTSPSSDDGTEWKSAGLNALLAQMRAVARKGGVPVSNLDDTLIARSIQAGKLNWIGNFAGTGNALTATLDPAPLALTAGLEIAGLVSSNNTDAVTLNLNGFGAVAIANNADGSILRRNELLGGSIARFRYDGSVWRYALSSTRVTGLKNLLLNPLFNVSVRNGSSYTGGVLAPGAFGFDRWRAGAGGCTFSTSGSVATITAGTLMQVVERLGLAPGQMTLSWSGTAQARVAGGAYAASPITVNATSNVEIQIEFGIGTMSQPQFELGSAPSTFEVRTLSQEIGLCARYCQPFVQTQRWTAGGPGQVLAQGMSLIPMAFTPTVVITLGGSLTNCTPSVVAGGNFSLIMSISAPAAGDSICSSRVGYAEAEF